MYSVPIRHLNPLNTQIGLRTEDAEYVQEVIYYCDSRLRAAMCRLHGLRKRNEHQLRIYLVEAVAMELVNFILIIM